MNLRFEILKAVAANPGAPINEIADAISYDRQKTAWSVRDCAQDGLLAKRLDDVTRQPGYTLTDAGKKRLAEGPAKLQGGNLKKGAKTKTSFNAGPRDKADAKKVEAEKGEKYSLLGVLADIRAAVGDPEGRLMQDELIERVRIIAEAGDESRADLNKICDTLLPHVFVGLDDRAPGAVVCAERVADLLRSTIDANRQHLNMIAIASETLATVAHSATDTSDMDLDELAKHVAEALTYSRRCTEVALKEHNDALDENTRLVAELANQTALVEKLEHLLQSARNEAEHLRRHANHSGDATDMVNHPPHYQGKVECIDAIEAALGAEGFVAYCRGNALKYSFRAGRKGDAAQDIQKARWYADRALQAINPAAAGSVPA